MNVRLQRRVCDCSGQTHNLTRSVIEPAVKGEGVTRRQDGRGGGTLNVTKHPPVKSFPAHKVHSKTSVLISVVSDVYGFCAKHDAVDYREKFYSFVVHVV